MGNASMSANVLTNRHLWYTLGPTSLGREREMLESGATGVRLTFGFGTPDIHFERAVLHKRLAEELGVPCTTVADLNGQKFRLGSFRDSPTIAVRAGTTVRIELSSMTAPNDENLAIPMPDGSFFSYLRSGTLLTIGDGAILRVVRVENDAAEAEMTKDGVINQARGVNIQDKEYRPQSLTEKDLRDLGHIISSSVYDVVALSFVSSAEDIKQVRQLIGKASKPIRIVAKIETAAGVENADAISQAADFVMAARGDLALSMPWLELPSAVNRIAAAAVSSGIPWLLATQIVEGLEHFAIPTRAEICDLAHWMDKACAGVLLSTETAFGSRPVDAVACTASMLRRYEPH